MTGISTNIGAMIALQTLRSIANESEKVQSQVSSGLRVNSAADNAAYWSIATTMRSDNLATSTVQDALSLGAAKIDTAYAGMNSTIEVLSEVKAKLVAAKEGGVDKQKIQKELDQLKDQVRSIATSASFNGVNWLNTDIQDIEDTAFSTALLTAAFTRDANGSVSLTQIPVDRIMTSLFNTTGGGILQTNDKSPGTIGGLKGTIYNFAPAGGVGNLDFTFAGPLTFVDDTTAVTFDITFDADDPAITPSPQAGTTKSFTINRTFIDSIYPSLNGVISTRTQWATVLREALKNDGYVSTSSNPNYFGISSKEVNGTGSAVELKNLASTLAGSATGGLVNSPVSYGTRAYTYSIFDGAFEMKTDVEASISINEAGVGKTMTFTRDDVMAALGSTDGKVTTKSEFISLMNYLFTRDGIAINATDDGSSFVRYDLDPNVHPETGFKSRVGVTGATDSIGNVATFDFLDIDITGSYSLDLYIQGVDVMLQKAISGAATLGAIKTRVELQTDFVVSMMKTVDRGIGRLVDADMNESSTRLKALQAQEQLAISSLQIANQSPSLMLQLFR